VIFFFFLLLSAGCGKSLQANLGVQHEAEGITNGIARDRATASPDVPAEYQAGIAQMGIAKGYLEKAENKCSGYRSEGIASIDHTLQACGVSPRSTPTKCNPATRTNPA
jgi:hypothetical protein